MLALRRQLAILGNSGPSVGQNLNLPNSLIYHRLDGENHSRNQSSSRSAFSIMWYLQGWMMKNFADAMADKIAHDRKAIALCHRLNGSTDVANTFIGSNFPDACPKALFGYFH